ncbi:hypothetical protein U3516DRAFT_762045 [Neocallimastix sp. 'constans']
MHPGLYNSEIHNISRTELGLKIIEIIYLSWSSVNTPKVQSRTNFHKDSIYFNLNDPNRNGCNQKGVRRPPFISKNRNGCSKKGVKVDRVFTQFIHSQINPLVRLVDIFKVTIDN